MRNDQPVPIVDFYGENKTWSTTELIHSEPLVERSLPNDWKIRPHRHRRLTQLFLLQRGGGTASLDANSHLLAPPCVVIVPEMCVHAFEWTKNSSGIVLSIASPLVHDLNREFGSGSATFARPAILPISGKHDHVVALFEEIDREHQRDLVMKEPMLNSLIKALAISLFRRIIPTPGTNMRLSRASKHFARFSTLVDEHHKTQRSVVSYASEIGITSSHLNSVCQDLARMSALSVIHERVLLAARRSLVYTEKTISGVSSGLGFSDPSYFTRFFKRHMGLSPSTFRRNSGTYDGGE